MRAYNQGRPVMKERQWAYVEEMMQKDSNPKVISMVDKLYKKRAKGMDPKLWEQRRKETLMQYV
jgi:hypothetical protein